MVAALAAWQYSDRLGGLLRFAIYFCFASIVCWGVCCLIGFWFSCWGPGLGFIEFSRFEEFIFWIFLVVQERSFFISISRLFFCWLRSLNLSGWDWNPRIWYSRHCKNQLSQISDFLQFQGRFFMISDTQGTNVHGYCCLGWRLARKLMTFHGDSGVIPDPESRVSLRWFGFCGVQ